VPREVVLSPKMRSAATPETAMRTSPVSSAT
jgi:hypothetical protein